jgi:hypothetical protein
VKHEGLSALEGEPSPADQAVVTDENDRAGKGIEGSADLVDEDGREVVRRFVEHQEIGGVAQDLGEGKSLTLAHGHSAYRHLELAGREQAECQQRPRVVELAARPALGERRQQRLLRIGQVDLLG